MGAAGETGMAAVQRAQGWRENWTFVQPLEWVGSQVGHCLNSRVKEDFGKM